tara:strand:- start:1293 stop:2750 length:1458 start_codon:yes stop_codon:yes gene_type:complete
MPSKLLPTEPKYSSGTTDKGEYLSAGERKMLFKKGKITGAAFKRGSSVGGAENVAADTTGASAMVKAGQPGALQQADAISQSPVASPALLNAVQAIAASVDSIIGILQGQAAAQQDAAEDARVAGEEKEGKGREKGLETKVFTGLKKVGEKIMKPVKSLWDKLLNFITTVLLGRALVKFLEWFGKPGNQEKIMSLFKFLKDWWPAIVAGLIAFASPLLGPVGVIAGVVALLMWGVPKIIDVAKYIGGLTGKIFAFLKGGPKGDNKVDTTTTPSGMSRKEARHGKIKDDTPTELEQGEQKQQQEIGQVAEPVAEMASGGQVPGSGNKDTVPAMLTPGEFVMSKGAVSKWGAGTLASMNAAGGGTNRPTMMFSGGGSVLQSTTSNFNIRGGYRGGGLITRPLKVQGFAGGGEVVGDSGDPNMELAPVQKLQEEISPPGGDPEAKAAAGEAAKSKRARTQSSPGTSIPDFSASTMISPDKIKTLGISV